MLQPSRTGAKSNCVGVNTDGNYGATLTIYYTFMLMTSHTFSRSISIVEIKFENNLLPYIELLIKSLMTSNKFVFIFFKKK